MTFRVRDGVKDNYFGNKLLQICHNNNRHICDGRMDGDTTGAYCIRGSVIDDLICNLDALLFVNNSFVHEYLPLLSDVKNPKP